MKKITDLPYIDEPAGNDMFYIVDADQNVSGYTTRADILRDAIDEVDVKDRAITPAKLSVDFAGVVTQYAGAAAPAGWLLCQGQAVSRTDYADLFAVVGTTYGSGDGSTTFNLPNLKGRIPVGLDAAQTEFDALGETGGQKTTRHAFISPPINTNNFQDGGTNYLTSVIGDINSYLTGDGSSSTSRSVAIRNVGGTIGSNGGTATEVGHYRYTAPNLQPYITMNYIIKT